MRSSVFPTYTSVDFLFLSRTLTGFSLFLLKSPFDPTIIPFWIVLFCYHRGRFTESNSVTYEPDFRYGSRRSGLFWMALTLFHISKDTNGVCCCRVQLFAFLLMSAGSAGASLNLVLNHHGVLDAVGNGCTDGHIIVFCSETEAAVAFTFLSFLVMEASALLAGYGLAPYLIVR